MSLRGPEGAVAISCDSALRRLLRRKVYPGLSRWLLAMTPEKNRATFL